VHRPGRTLRFSVRFLVRLGVLFVMDAVFTARGEWQAVRCIPVIPPLAKRIETIRIVSDPEQAPPRWKDIRGSQQAAVTIRAEEGKALHGNKALVLDYEFSGKLPLEYVEVAPPDLPISGPGLGLAMRIRMEGARLTPRARLVDKSGEVHQRDFELSAPDHDGWVFAAVLFDSHGGSWDGDGNHRLDYPCRLRSLVFDRPKRGWKGTGSVLIDRVMLIAPKKIPPSSLRVEVQALRLGNLYRPGETVLLRAFAPAGSSIRWRVRNFFDKTLAQGEGSASGVQVQFRLPRQGWYACRFTVLDSKGETIEEQDFACAAIPPASPDERNSFVGVCSHFCRPTLWPSEAMQILVHLGIRQIRDELSWGSVETKPGVLSIPRDRAAYLDRARELGLDVLLILDYANRFYDEGNYPNSPEAIQGFARYAEFLVRELRGRIAAVEVWNEWSGGCGMGGRSGDHGPEAYARLLKPTFAAIRRADSEIPVVAIGGDHSRHHFDRIERMLKAGIGRACDALSVHSYRYPRTPEETDLVGEITRVADLARKLGAPSSIWVTEIGWPTHEGPRGVDEAVQARMAVRTLALLHGTKTVAKVYWYDFKDDGLRRDYNEHNFGIVHHQACNYAPKPAAIAMAVFARLTAGLPPPELVQTSDAWMARYHRPNGDELVIVWRPEAAALVRVSGRGIRVQNLMGADIDFNGRLRIGPDPLYVSGRSVRIEM